MESELSDLSREKRALDLAMMENKHRLSATTKEMMKEREQSHNLKVELRNVKAGLHNTSRFIQEPKELKEAIKSLYKKYLLDFDKVHMYMNVCGYCITTFSGICDLYYIYCTEGYFHGVKYLLTESFTGGNIC